MKFGILNAKHTDYCECETHKLEILYKGGKEIEEHASLFIPQEAARGESALLYHDRLKSVSYRNYLAKIINDYVSDLFSKPFSVITVSDSADPSTVGDDIGKEEPFYKEFAEDVDLQNHTLAYILSNLMKDALVTGRAYLGVDFPKVDETPRNIKDEEETNASRAYVYSVPTLSVIDWNKDNFGKYTFLVLKNVTVPRKTFEETRDKQVISFKVWEKQDDNTITWKLFEITTKIGKEPNKNDDVPLVDEGMVSFKDIPVLCMEIPSHLWIGNLIGSMTIEHFRRSSSLVFAMQRNLFSIPVYKQGAEIGAGERPALSSLGMDENRGNSTSRSMAARGFAVIGPDDEIEFVEPDGKVYEICNTQLKELVDSMHQVINQMSITAITGTIGGMDRSGLSKMMDNHSKELVLYAYASLIKDFATTLYTVISEGRNENIIWRAVGFESFAILDRDQLVKEATAAVKIPSATFTKHYLLNMSSALCPDMNAQTSLQVKKEIDEAVDSMSEEELMGKEPEEAQEESTTDSKPDKTSPPANVRIKKLD
jgi:hypothetical protein